MPFLIPTGTKVRLTDNRNGWAQELFFAGYRVYGAEYIYGKDYGIFPCFKAITRQGTMSNRNPSGWGSNTLGAYDLEHYEIDIVDYCSDNAYELLPRIEKKNRLNDIICGAVSVCTTEMLAIAKRLGIDHISFSEYPDVETPSATFNKDSNVELGFWEEVESLAFDQENTVISIASVNGNTAYLDTAYGDYFDVAQSLPHIYRAFMEIATKLSKEKDA